MSKIANGCWIWTGALNAADGYGAFGVNRDGRYKAISAHGCSWELYFGPVPQGQHVCHDCPGGDNKLCVNPDHFWLGTARQNARDASRKGQLIRKRHDLNPATNLIVKGAQIVSSRP
jgi:hypothetical protein